MPTTEELLAQLEVEAQGETPVCVIDPETRTISVPPEYQLLGVENDKRVERIYFQCPKIVGDNQDLSQNYQLFINYQNANGDPDAHHIDDMEVDGDNITFSWLLEENVTKYKGSIRIAFAAIIPGDEAEDPDKNRWNTTINTDCTCLVGLKSTKMVAESNPDALAQIWAAIDELKAGGGGSGTPGKDGREIELQNSGTAIQWRYVGDESWTDLVQLSEITGEKGDPGVGVPLGGTTGQVLTKNSESDGDASWKDPSSVSDEQVKTAVDNYLEENPVAGITQEQIMALDSMFKICAFTIDPLSQYQAFCDAFGIQTGNLPETPSGSFVYDPNKWVYGKKPNPTTGEIEEIAVYSYYNEMIPVNSNTSFHIVANTAVIMYMYQYNEDGYISVTNGIFFNSSNGLEQTFSFSDISSITGNVTKIYVAIRNSKNVIENMEVM